MRGVMPRLELMLCCTDSQPAFPAPPPEAGLECDPAELCLDCAPCIEESRDVPGMKGTAPPGGWWPTRSLKENGDAMHAASCESFSLGPPKFTLTRACCGFRV